MFSHRQKEVLMLKKILLSLILVIAISSCRGKTGATDQMVDQNENPAIVSEQNQQPETLQPVEDEAAAAALNKQTEAQIEEVEVSDRIFFDLDKSALSDDAKKILDNQIAWLKSDNAIRVVIEGHCDERGTREYNIALGARRAEAVKAYLAQNGIDASRIKTVSYGKERPAFVGTGESIWSKNRRAVTAIQ